MKALKIPAKIASFKGITALEKLMWAYINNADKVEGCLATNKEIASDLTSPDKQINLSLMNLDYHGLIKIEVLRIGGKPVRRLSIIGGNK